MAEQIGSLYADLALESASFLSGLRRATDAARSSEGAINKAFGSIRGAVTGLAAALSVDALIGATKRAFDYADAIVDLSDRTGASTKFIQEFAYAAQLSGSSVETAHTGLEKFTKKLGEAQAGSKSARAELLALGVTSYDTDRAVLQAADGIAKLDSRQKQAAATTDLFGKKAMDLTLLMSGGSQAISDLSAKAGQLGIVLEDDVLRNAGQVNDKLDTMRMILDAQFANMIIKNADAISGMADQLMRLAGAATAALAAMDRQGALAAVNSQGKSWFTDSAVIPAAVTGQTREQYRASQRKLLLSSAAGQADLYNDAARRRRALTGATSGSGRVSAQRWQTATPRERAEYNRLTRNMNDASAARYALEHRAPPRPVVSTTRTLTPTGGKTKTPHASTPPHLRTDAELADAWAKDLSRAQAEELQARIGITNGVHDRAELERQLLNEQYQARVREIAAETGTDQEVREGKKRYTAAQSAQLKALEEQSQTERLQLSYNRENEELARDKLAIAQAGLTNDADLLNGQAGLARSTRERRDIALRLVDLQYKQEKLALQAIIASEQATDADKKIAQARLDVLDRLRGQAEDKARRDNMGPLAQYLDAIPKTRDEINDALESVEAEGLESLRSGLLDCIKGTGDLGDAFKAMTGKIIDGLLDIAIRQAIIKPLGSLLFGGGDEGGGGGLLGGILKTVATTAVTKGGKANGGMGNAGNWLVGEHGPEVLQMGGPFNVIPHNKLQSVAGGGGSLSITFGQITSNDPVMVQRLATQAIVRALPMIAEQSKNTTLTKLNRRNL